MTDVPSNSQKDQLPDYFRFQKKRKLETGRFTGLPLQEDAPESISFLEHMREMSWMLKELVQKEDALEDLRIEIQENLLTEKSLKKRLKEAEENLELANEAKGVICQICCVETFQYALFHLPNNPTAALLNCGHCFCHSCVVKMLAAEHKIEVGTCGLLTRSPLSLFKCPVCNDGKPRHAIQLRFD